LQQAEQTYQEALLIRRAEARANPDAYLPDLAMTLNNLAILHSHTHRPEESLPLHKDALDIRQRLASVNPEAHLPASL
jgi:hypothetical protein